MRLSQTGRRLACLVQEERIWKIPHDSLFVKFSTSINQVSTVILGIFFNFFIERKSVYVDRSELLSLDPIRSRSFVKSSREFKRQNETERAANQSEVQISIKTPAQIFGSTLSSFLKIKATKAYEFGEGLVRSITSDKRKISEHFMLEE